MGCVFFDKPDDTLVGVVFDDDILSAFVEQFRNGLQSIPHLP